MNRRALTNWAGWVIGSGLILYSIYLYSGLPSALFGAGVWVILTGFGYHAIGVIEGVQAEITSDDEDRFEDSSI